MYFDGWGVNAQYNWLEKDLSYASAPQNRTLRPWIITYGHRPMYCSALDGDDCTTSKSVIRAGYVLELNIGDSNAVSLGKFYYAQRLFNNEIA